MEIKTAAPEVVTLEKAKAFAELQFNVMEIAFETSGNGRKFLIPFTGTTLGTGRTLSP